jgi:putative membrane protein (TIGR04086 family)
MMKLKPWPVVAGILVDSLGSIAVGLVYFVAVLGAQIARGREVTDEIVDSHVSIVTILGLLLTAAGGFVAGRLAKTDEVRHGIAVGVGSVLIWLLLEWLAPAEGAESIVEAISFFAVIPAAALGGYGAARMNRRTASPLT